VAVLGGSTFGVANDHPDRISATGEDVWAVGHDIEDHHGN
jgi:hypothetical protein